MSLMNIPREPELFPEDELRAAAGTVREAMLAALDKDDDPGRTFSPAFAIRMEPLLRLDRRRTGRRRFLQRAAVFLLAVLLTGTLILAVNPDARAAFFGWVRTFYETKITYVFNNDPSRGSESADEWEFPEFDFSLLEGEYEVELSSESPTNKVYLITRESEVYLLKCTFYANVDSLGEIMQFVAGEYIHESVSVNGFNGDYYESSTREEDNALSWNNEEAMVSFRIFSFSGKDEIVAVAEKIKCD